MATLTALNAQSTYSTPFGIGTTSPQASLHVHDAIVVPNPDFPINLRDESDSSRDGIFPNNYSSRIRLTNPNSGSTSSDGLTIDLYNNDAVFKLNENGSIILSASNNFNSVYLTNSGQFSIGQPVSNTYKFSVSGTSNFGGNVTVQQSLLTRDTLSVGTISIPGTFIVYGPSILNGAVTVTNNVQFNNTMSVHGAVTMDNSLTVLGSATISNNLTAGGSATISNNLTVLGSATIDHDLTVGRNLKVGNGLFCDNEGFMRVKHLKVTLTGWADYVFSPGYSLMSLKDVENYIGEHSHLPGVPSAAEIEKDGADLGEMNRILMEKVEELTLYIIDLQKQIDELKSNQ
jgi:cytoskeletal protein CcmA (bactofilin family)